MTTRSILDYYWLWVLKIMKIHHVGLLCLLYCTARKWPRTFILHSSPTSSYSISAQPFDLCIWTNVWLLCITLSQMKWSTNSPNLMRNWLQKNENVMQFGKNETQRKIKKLWIWLLQLGVTTAVFLNTRCLSWHKCPIYTLQQLLHHLA